MATCAATYCSTTSREFFKEWGGVVESEVAVKLLHLPDELAGAGRGEYCSLAAKLIHLPGELAGVLLPKLNGYDSSIEYPR